MKINGLTVVIFGGKTGLLGQSLTRAFDKAGARPIPLSSEDCDILDPMAVAKLLEREKPDLLINAAAYTLVDQAEDEQEKAFALNATAPPLLAAQAARCAIPFVHYSTDFVFRGDKTTPYTEEDQPASASSYGISKADGERGLLKLGYAKTLIIRISWLFGPGRINFVRKILDLADTNDRLTVVDDQLGSPSYAPDVAANTLLLLKADATGIYHLANSGQTSWYGLAAKAVDLAGKGCEVSPVTSEEYPTKAARPAYSVLDLGKFVETTGVTPRSWEDALKEYVKGMMG